MAASARYSRFSRISMYTSTGKTTTTSHAPSVNFATAKKMCIRDRDNTAETTATGYLYSDHAGKIAVLVKSTRNALIGFVVLGFALYWAARGQADKIAPGAKAKVAFIWDKFPKFVLGFLAVSAIATAHWLSKEMCIRDSFWPW